MNAAKARDQVLDRALSIDSEQFEHFCKMFVEQVESPRDIELTPFHGDGGIDIRGAMGRGTVNARFGVQVKQYSSGNTVGTPDMRGFMGALQQHGYHCGTFITSSSFVSDAVDIAEDASILLLDREALLDVMLSNELGVREDRTGYVIDEGFWNAFEEPERTGILPTAEVPQADRIEILELCLQAVDEGYDVKPEIAKYLRVHDTRDVDWDNRQGDYYATACWLLGYLHRDMETEYGDETMRQWGLTREGEEYLSLLRDGDEDAKQERLRDAIHGVEIVQRALERLSDQGSMTHTELKELIEKESKVSGSTIKRRATSVGVWLSQLHEVQRKRSRQVRYEYNSNIKDWL